LLDVTIPDVFAALGWRFILDSEVALLCFAAYQADLNGFDKN
jgi:hypothetical protein